ncbi:MAG: hypothetical protein K2G73_07060, partial [Eubacterium sp.]|nr:hypothetical protein [Eubacterium sp.]
MNNISKSIISVLIASAVLVSSNAVALANDIESDFLATNQTAVTEAVEQEVLFEKDFESDTDTAEKKEEKPEEPSTEKPEEKPTETPSQKPEEKPIEDSFQVTLSKTKITYCGTVQKPTVTVKNKDGKVLKNNKDYTLEYSNKNSKNAGTYKVTVKYIGKYSGSYDYEYKIVPRGGAKPVLNRTVITRTGTVQRPTVTVKDDLGNNLTYKKDFTVDYSNWSSKNAGTYKVTVKMIGNYKGTKTYNYYIVDGKITLSRTKINYVGTVQRPTVKVTDAKGKALTYKKDFTVDYSNWNSKDVGTYKVTVKMIGKYSGSAVYSYKIVPQTNVTPKLNRTDIKKTGTVQRPTVTVKDYKNNVLTYKKDFTVDYSNWNSKKEGVYTVTVKMMGNYAGTSTYKYYINDPNYLPLNTTATHISHEYANVKKEIFGKSVQGRNLEAFIITPSNGKFTKTFFMTFAIHGFEDSYSRDGQLLTAEGNKLVEYYAKNPKMLKNYRLVIVPCLNPDGTIAGVNNQRACSTAFGRCTAKHVDMNRDFVSFQAIESRYLKDFLNKYRPDVFTDFHGWLDETIGTGALCNIYNKHLG